MPLAYVQLYLANQLADLVPKPWERYLPAYKNVHKQATLGKTPSQTQRSFANILEVIGSPAAPSISRGNPLGRATGVVLDKREPQPINFKSSNQQNSSKKSISAATENGQEKTNTNEIDMIMSRLKIDLKKLGLSQSEVVKLLFSSA